MYVYIYIYICMCMYVCVYIYIYTYIHITQAPFGGRSPRGAHGAGALRYHIGNRGML